MPLEFPDVSMSDGQDSKDFIVLKDGGSIQGILKGKVIVFYKHGFGQSSSICPGTSNCEKCKEGDKKKFRCRFNFIINENGNFVPKILEQGWKAFEDIKALEKEGGYDLEKTVTKITRKGAGKNDTVYSFIPLQNQTISDAVAKKLAEVKLLDLVPKKEEVKQESSANSFMDNAPLTDEDVPF